MNEETTRFPVLRFTSDSSDRTEDVIVREFPLTIILNDQELVTLLCSPMDLKHLAVGFLLSEGFIDSREEVDGITVDDVRGVVRVSTREDKGLTNEFLFKRMITSGCGRGASFYSAADAQSLTKVDADGSLSVAGVFELAKQFQQHSRLYLATHGVHSAALCDTDILIFAEDIGRHNAIDKVFGRCLFEGIPTSGRTVVTSGRVSSEILLKVAKRNIPIIVSISAPTDVAVELADTLGVTLVCSVRGGGMKVYSHDRRVVPEER